MATGDLVEGRDTSSPGSQRTYQGVVIAADDRRTTVVHVDTNGRASTVDLFPTTTRTISAAGSAEARDYATRASNAPNRNASAYRANAIATALNAQGTPTAPARRTASGPSSAGTGNS